jgi:hypothetical protein
MSRSPHEELFNNPQYNILLLERPVNKMCGVWLEKVTPSVIAAVMTTGCGKVGLLDQGRERTNRALH